MKPTESLGPLASLEPEFMTMEVFIALHFRYRRPLSAVDEPFRFRMEAGQAKTLPILLAGGNAVLGIQ